MKIDIRQPWLKEVEAVEEQLESMKLSAWRLSPRIRIKSKSIVEETAGLLGKRFMSGSIYQRRVRNTWEEAFLRRTS